MRVAQQRAAQGDQVGVAVLEVGLGAFGRVDHADRHDVQVRHGGPDLPGERHLIAGLHGDLLLGAQAAAAEVHGRDALAGQQATQDDGLRFVPAALDPVGGAQAHEQRLVHGPGVPDGARDFQQQPHAVLEGAAVGVGAGVRQRRQELVQQVAVRGVNLDGVEAGHLGAAGGLREVGGDAGNVVGCHGARGGERVAVRLVAGADDGPAATFLRNGAASAPGGVGAGLASGVRELRADQAAVRVNEVRDAAQRDDVLVVPQAQVLGADAALGGHRDGLGEDQAHAGQRVLPQVHEVEVVRHATTRRVHAHGRDDHAVGEGQLREFQRLEQQGSGVVGTGCHTRESRAAGPGGVRDSRHSRRT